MVEAARTSGSQITATAALDASREVLAVPGPISAETSEGTNGLIRDGCAPFLTAEDLWSRLPGATPVTALASRLEPRTRRVPEGLSIVERRIAQALLLRERDVDMIAHEAGLETVRRAVRTALTRAAVGGGGAARAEVSAEVRRGGRGGRGRREGERLGSARAPLHPRTLLRPALQLLRFRHRRAARGAFAAVRRCGAQEWAAGRSTRPGSTLPSLDTVYFGGGTPSLLEAGQLIGLIAQSAGTAGRHRRRDHARGQSRRRDAKRMPRHGGRPG